MQRGKEKAVVQNEGRKKSSARTLHVSSSTRAILTQESKRKPSVNHNNDTNVFPIKAEEEEEENQEIVAHDSSNIIGIESFSASSKCRNEQA